MKVNILTQAMAVLPIVSAAVACEMRVQWISNWPEGLAHRYRVMLITNPQDDRLLGVYCDALNEAGSQKGGSNLACFWENGQYLADYSFVKGPLGHNQYLDSHNTAAGMFRDRTGCGTVMDI